MTALADVRPAAPTPINDVVPCTTGQIVVSGTSDVEVIPAVIDLDMDFQNCDDIDGLISVDALVTLGLGALDLEVVQNGTVAAEECEEITMTDLTVRVSTDLSGQFLTPPLTSGTISGTCEGVAFTCTLDQLDVRDEAGFADSCDV